MDVWFRFYNDVLNDPKIQCLPASTFKIWVNFLCLASRHDGTIPAPAEVAFMLRCTEAQATAWIQKLMDLQLLDEIDGHIEPHNWDSRQHRGNPRRPETGDRPTSTDRVKRFRERKRNANETPDETLRETRSGETPNVTLGETLPETPETSRASARQTQTQIQRQSRAEQSARARAAEPPEEAQGQARKQFDASEYDHIEQRCIATIPKDHPSWPIAASPTVHPVPQLVAEGHDLETVILPLMHGIFREWIARPFVPQSWRLVAGSIREEIGKIARHERPAPKPVPQRVDTHKLPIDWDWEMDIFLGGGGWNIRQDPRVGHVPPNRADTRVPQDVLDRRMPKPDPPRRAEPASNGVRETVTDVQKTETAPDPPSPDLTPPKPVDAEELEAMTEGYRVHGQWDDAEYGPPPGKPGCRVPAEILREHGFEPVVLQ